MKAALGTLFIVGVLVAGPAAQGIAHAQTAKAAASTDSRLDKRIEARLHNDAVLKRYSIHVSVDNGVATLTGTVPTEADRSKATHVATIPGISRVDNQLIVDLNAATSAKG